MDVLGGHYANAKRNTTNTVCYHLHVESKKENKLVNIIKMMQIHRDGE